MTVGCPWTVVGTKHKNRIVIYATVFQGLVDLPNRPVEFHHDVAVKAFAWFPFEVVTKKRRHMRLRVGDIEKERLALLAVNEINHFFG